MTFACMLLVGVVNQLLCFFVLQIGWEAGKDNVLLLINNPFLSAYHGYHL